MGLDHDSHTQYESRFVHRDLAFTNFTVAGVRVGHNQYGPGGVASAEMTFENCLFAANAAGVALLAWNDYDNYFTRCHFVGNGYGIAASAGNMYVTNTRFEGSTLADATVTAHANSFRRVVSVGSARFLTTLPGNGGGAPTKLQSVVVHGWGESTAAATPAIYLGERGPIQMFDSVFEAPINASSPALALGGGGGGATEAVIISNVTAPLLLDPGTAYNVSHLYVLPNASSSVASLLPPLSSSTGFFSSQATHPPLPTAIYDAVVDFGADPSGRAVSSAALAACVAAAAAAANGSTCYLQAGTYTVNETLRVCGSNVSLSGGGSGFGVRIQWLASAPGPAAVLATGPGAGCVGAVSVTLQRLNCFSSERPVGGVIDLAISRVGVVPASLIGLYNATTIAPAQVAVVADTAATVQVECDGMYVQSPGGAVIASLTSGDSVRGALLDGDMAVMDSGDAVVLPDFYAAGANGMVVGMTPPQQSSSHSHRGGSGSGSGSVGGGFTGAMVMVSASSAYDLAIFNSSSFAVADHYTETSHANAYLEGRAGDAPGRVTISAAKLNTNSPTWPATTIVDYAGAFMHTGGVVSYSPLNVTITAGVPVATNATWLGEALWTNGSAITMTGPYSSGVMVTMLASLIVSTTPPWEADVNAGAAGLAAAAAGLDHLRELGALDFARVAAWAG